MGRAATTLDLAGFDVEKTFGTKLRKNGQGMAVFAFDLAQNERGLSGFAGGNVKVYKMGEGSLHPIHLNNMPIVALSAGQLVLA